MRAFTDAATLSCHFIFLKIDWGKIEAQGVKGDGRKEEREGLRLAEDERMSPRWKEECEVLEVFTSPQVD